MTQGTVRPTTQGLYDPQYEHDACGVGFVVDIKGRKSHEIVQQALQVLVNLSHRGACGCDPQTGDGAGILLQIPHEFFVQECAKLGINLPGPGQYGVGVAFFSPNPGHREHCERKIMEVVAGEMCLSAPSTSVKSPARSCP